MIRHKTILSHILSFSSQFCFFSVKFLRQKLAKKALSSSEAAAVSSAGQGDWSALSAEVSTVPVAPSVTDARVDEALPAIGATADQNRIKLWELHKINVH